MGLNKEIETEEFMKIAHEMRKFFEDRDINIGFNDTYYGHLAILIQDKIKEALQSQKEEIEKMEIIIPEGKTHKAHDKCQLCYDLAIRKIIHIGEGMKVNQRIEKGQILNTYGKPTVIGYRHDTKNAYNQAISNYQKKIKEA